MEDFGSIQIFKQEIDSTNKELWRIAESGAQMHEGLTIWAGFQNQGRGMAGTSWHGEAGKNLTCSFLLKPVFLDPGKQFILNKCIAVSICKALKIMAPKHDFLIKWPNDTYYKSKKIAGTLIENRIQGRIYDLCVAGIGININQQIFPEEIPNPSSLARITGKEYDLKKCLKILSDQVKHHYKLLKAGHSETINSLYLEHLLGYKRRMTFRKNETTFTAIIQGVSEYGKLILSNEQGNHAFDMKEVEFVF